LTGDTSLVFPSQTSRIDRSPRTSAGENDRISRIGAEKRSFSGPVRADKISARLGHSELPVE
jgi:hypothetical protein